MNQTDTVVRCDDGTELRFEWVYEGAEALEWMHDRAHWPDPGLPMEVWMRRRTWAGADRCWEETGIEPMPMFKRFQMVGPYLYVRTTMPPPEELMRIAAPYPERVRPYGNTRGFWDAYAQPRIKQAAAVIASSAPDTPPEDVAEMWGWGFHQTFTTSSLMSSVAIGLTIMLAEPLGPDAMLAMHEVTQGGENASQQIDGEINDLAQLARNTPAAARILKSSPPDEALPALRREPAAVPFVDAFDALIARHASRSLGWDLSQLTWGERPEAPLAFIAAQLDADVLTPAEIARRSDETRRETTERVLAKLPSDKHDEFKRLVAANDGYVYIREGRAYWQNVVTGEVRLFLLRVGAELAREGRIAEAADILYLTPDDYGDGSPRDLRSLVEQRRGEQEHWRSTQPPAVIGTPSTPPMPDAPAGELRGAPASRGTVTGRARILHSPEEGSTLEAGDILVCVRTTPSWTPLFAVIAGIVTETGGALSHPAITAREYGIPAVLAVKDAMKLIRDGQMISIDGGAGTVALHA